MAKSSGGLLLLVLGGAAVAAFALKGSSAPAQQPPSGSGGISPNPSANGGIFTGLHNSAVLLAAANSIGLNKNPVDWSATDVNFLNQIVALKAQGFSSADALTVAQSMAQGLTFSQAVIALLQPQGIPVTQANQIVALVQQGTPFPQAVAQTTPSPPAPGLSVWQQKAATSIANSSSGIDPVTAQSIASQLTDAQSRYMDWLIRLGHYSYDNARPLVISGAPELATGWQIESGMSQPQQRALGWLFQDAWAGQSGISSSWPPTPAAVRRLAQLASAMSDTNAQVFISKISSGVGIQDAYEQTIGTTATIQVQPDGSVTSTA